MCFQSRYWRVCHSSVCSVREVCECVTAVSVVYVRCVSVSQRCVNEEHDQQDLPSSPEALLSSQS